MNARRPHGLLFGSMHCIEVKINFAYLKNYSSCVQFSTRRDGQVAYLEKEFARPETYFEETVGICGEAVGERGDDKQVIIRIAVPSQRF